ncbi:hypothetical protein P7C73_g4049, partial [Tremellales sp. Uapishka_1]
MDFTYNLLPSRLRVEMMRDPDERLIVRHYLTHTVHIITAFESPTQPWNPWLSVHIPLAFIHPPNTSHAADALRIAILAVGAVHLRYVNDPTDQESAWKITRSAKSKVLKLVQQTLENRDGTPKDVDSGEIELVLAALLSCTIANSLAADDSWHELLNTVISLIERVGGAPHLLQDSPRDHMSPCRFFCEQLAIRDVFGCMSTEMAPRILKDAFTPWFFEAEGWSRGDDEWESVERMFGMSRGMVDIIARSCSLISQVCHTNYHIYEHQDASYSPLDCVTPTTNPSASFHLRLPERIAARLSVPTYEPSSLRSTAEYPAPLAEHLDPDLDPEHESERAELEDTANDLMAELKIWDQASNFTPIHPRTQYGDHCYRLATRIRLLRNVFRVSSTDHRVISAADAIMELAKEMLAQYGRIVWLTWPILVAGFHIPKDDPARRAALEMLGAFGPHACFDNTAASRMLAEYWEFHDRDEEDLPPSRVIQRLNSRPFLD